MSSSAFSKIWALLLLASISQAATISKPYTFSSGTVISSSQVNSCFDAIYNDYNGNINVNNLADNAVQTAKIAASAVTTAKIADSNVTTAKIADANVTTAKIADLNVTTGKLADTAVTTAKITDANVTLAKIVSASAASRLLGRGSAAGAGVFQEISLDGSTVEFNGTTIRVKASGITSNELASNAVTTAKIADANVTTAKIADANVTLAKMATGSVDDTKMSALSVVPVGTVVDYAGTSAPSGWLLCDGSSQLRSTYAALFTAIGTTYGAVDGTHFNLPDLRGRATFGRDDMGGSAASRITNGGSSITGTTLGAAGGDQLLSAHTHLAGESTGVSLGGGATVRSTATTGVNTSSTGGGASANMPPAMIMNKIIKAGV